MKKILNLATGAVIGTIIGAVSFLYYVESWRYKNKKEVKHNPAIF